MNLGSAAPNMTFLVCPPVARCAADTTIFAPSCSKLLGPISACSSPFDPDAYGVMVDRLSQMIRTFFKQSRQPRAKGQRMTHSAGTGKAVHGLRCGPAAR